MKSTTQITKILFFTLFISFASAQNKETIALMESIKNDYTLENGTIVYQQILEFPGKSNSELFDSALDFLENYTDSQIKVSSNDASRGKIKAWGFLKEFNNENSWGVDITISATYNIAIDVKDEKVRLRITPADYFKKEDGTGLSDTLSSLAGTTSDADLASALLKTSGDVNEIVEGDFKIITAYPFNPNGDQKNIWGRSFYKLNAHIKKLFPDFHKYMKDNVNNKW